VALGDPYITSVEAGSYLGTANPGDDQFLDSVVRSATAEIDQWCGRTFNRTEDASARKFRPDRVGNLIYVDDFWTLDELTVVDSDTTWTVDDDLTVLPLNGVVNGVDGYPYTQLAAYDGPRFSTTLTVTAKWGWPAVPAPVKQACFILAAELFKLKDSPGGVAGFNEFGVVRLREIPQVHRLLEPYRIRTFTA
jgi:hypothetical protein